MASPDGLRRLKPVSEIGRDTRASDGQFRDNPTAAAFQGKIILKNLTIVREAQERFVI
jgi:hypothetical protein